MDTSQLLASLVGFPTTGSAEGLPLAADVHGSDAAAFRLDSVNGAELDFETILARLTNTTLDVDATGGGEFPWPTDDSVQGLLPAADDSLTTAHNAHTIHLVTTQLEDASVVSAALSAGQDAHTEPIDTDSQRSELGGTLEPIREFISPLAEPSVQVVAPDPWVVGTVHDPAAAEPGHTAIPGDAKRAVARPHHDEVVVLAPVTTPERLGLGDAALPQSVEEPRPRLDSAPQRSSDVDASSLLTSPTHVIVEGSTLLPGSTPSTQTPLATRIPVPAVEGELAPQSSPEVSVVAPRALDDPEDRSVARTAPAEEAAETQSPRHSARVSGAVASPGATEAVASPTAPVPRGEQADRFENRPPNSTTQSHPAEWTREWRPNVTAAPSALETVSHDSTAPASHAIDPVDAGHVNTRDVDVERADLAPVTESVGHSTTSLDADHRHELPDGPMTDREQVIPAANVKSDRPREVTDTVRDESTDKSIAGGNTNTSTPNTSSPNTSSPNTDATQTDNPNTDATQTDNPNTDGPKSDGGAQTDGAQTDGTLPTEAVADLEPSYPGHGRHVPDVHQDATGGALDPINTLNTLNTLTSVNEPASAPVAPVDTANVGVTNDRVRAQGTHLVAPPADSGLQSLEDPGADGTLLTTDNRANRTSTDGEGGELLPTFTISGAERGRRESLAPTEKVVKAAYGSENVIESGHSIGGLNGNTIDAPSVPESAPTAIDAEASPFAAGEIESPETPAPHPPSGPAPIARDEEGEESANTLTISDPSQSPTTSAITTSPPDAPQAAADEVVPPSEGQEQTPPVLESYYTLQVQAERLHPASRIETVSSDQFISLVQERASMMEHSAVVDTTSTDSWQVRLDPPGVDVQVVLTQEDGQLSADFYTTETVGAALLQSRLGQLRDALQDAGFDVGDLEVLREPLVDEVESGRAPDRSDNARDPYSDMMDSGDRGEQQTARNAPPSEATLSQDGESDDDGPPIAVPARLAAADVGRQVDRIA